MEPFDWQEGTRSHLPADPTVAEAEEGSHSSDHRGRKHKLWRT